MEKSAEQNIADSELHRVRDEFVNRVSNAIINQLLDKFFKDRVFNYEEMELIRGENSTRTQRARALIDSVRGKGPEACQKMIVYLESKDPFLSQSLGLSSAQLFLSDEVKSENASRHDLSEKQLLQVAEQFGIEWKQVAIHLGLKSQDLDNLEDTEKNVTMRKLKMLLKWKRRSKPGEATAYNLLESLKDMKDIPVEVHEILKDMVDNKEDGAAK